VQYTRRKSYNIAHRDDDAFIDNLAQRGIAYVPFFPLGGFNPFQSATLDGVADSLGATPTQVALAWLAPTFTQYSADSRNLVGATPAGESPSRNIDVAIGRARQTRGPWHEVRTKT
jgi:aryl-alcohol dehydrogenase-like predicted oxidoreductase